MTISYSDSFLSLLGYWRGSVWRSVWKQLLAWLTIYYCVRFFLDYGLPHTHHNHVKSVVKYFDKIVGQELPLSFILGFYVSQVATRWWSQVMTIPVPDNIVAVTNSCFLSSHDRAIRQTVARWLVLSQAMAFRRLSTRIRKRFAKLDDLVDAGLLTKQELAIIRNTQCIGNRWQLPLDWIINKVIAPSEIPAVIQAPFVGIINNYRDNLRTLFMIDWVCLPLVYTQTCSIVVYGYFAFCLVGRQYYGAEIDLYVPWVTALQFIFYVGWLNVARDLMRPFGEDDDDIELNCILDRNASVAMNMANQVCENSPDIIFDEKLQQVFVDKMLKNMSYSKASLATANHPPKLHAIVEFKEDEEKSQGPPLNFTPSEKYSIYDLLPWVKRVRHPPNYF